MLAGCMWACVARWQWVAAALLVHAGWLRGINRLGLGLVLGLGLGLG